MRTRSSMLFTAAIVALSMTASTAQLWSQSPDGAGPEHNASVRAVERSSTTAGDGGMSAQLLLRRLRPPLNAMNLSEVLTAEIRRLPFLGLPLSRRFEYFETACWCTGLHA